MNIKYKNYLLVGICCSVVLSLVRFTRLYGQVVPGKTISLFNGKNLEGWYTFINGEGGIMIPRGFLR
jgi:hypothetical protein